MPENLIPAGPRNDRAVKHGATSVLLIAPRAEALAGELVDNLPAFAESDRPAVNRLAEVYARLEAAYKWYGEKGLLDQKGNPWPILARVDKWETTAANLEDRLGMNPVARAKLGLDLVRGESLAMEVQRFAEGGESARERLKKMERDDAS